VETETDRLILREWRHDEADALFDIMTRPEVMRWLGDGPTVLLQDVSEAHLRIDRWAEKSADPPRCYWALVPKSGGPPVGSVMLLTLPNAEAGEVEIGWWLHPDAWGRGYATEAARSVLVRAFDAGLPEVVAVTHPGNEPSAKVARKLGMTYQGLVHKWYDDPVELFRIGREEWHPEA
jgi:RimJ/RimL family protein N-acetyltransferase